MVEQAQSLIPKIESHGVSSVSGKNHSDYGKQFLIDGDGQSCWMSDQGNSQYVKLKFSEPVHIKKLLIMFQGGFVAKSIICASKTEGGSGKWEQKAALEPQDSNDEQIFDVDLENVAELKLLFPTSTDFYGRICIYKLDVY